MISEPHTITITTKQTLDIIKHNNNHDYYYYYYNNSYHQGDLRYVLRFLVFSLSHLFCFVYCLIYL